MKSAKSFFEFWIKIVVRAATRDKHFTFYVRAFATIFIPCLLQFPLMAHGKDGHDVVNSGLVLGKRISESTVTHKTVSDIGKLGSKSSLVVNNSGTNNIPSAAPQGKVMTSDDAGRNKEAANESSDDGYWYIYFLLPIVMAWAAGVFDVPNVEPTGARARWLELGATLAARPGWAPG